MDLSYVAAGVAVKQPALVDFGSGRGKCLHKPWFLLFDSI
jgi:hypothetical protein